MTRKSLTRIVSGAVLVGSVLAPAAVAPQQQMFVYPERGQTPEQQARDTAECRAWASQQTGFDPAAPQAATAPPPSASPAPQGGALRGGARGAAVGAVGGAIGGSAGTGAAVGAATGALFGTMRRHDQERQVAAEQQNWQAQQQAQVADRYATYARAQGACLAGRGYTVR
jgi:hypothetical protein